MKVQDYKIPLKTSGAKLGISIWLCSIGGSLVTLAEGLGCIPLLGCHSLNYSSVTLEAKRMGFMHTQ